VPWLHKAAGVACEHLAPGGEGCACYATRPPECGAYQCRWLLGDFRPEDRPDRTGVLFDVLQGRTGAVLMAHVRPAGIRAAGKVLLEELQRLRPVYVVRGHEVELRGPRPMVEGLFFELQKHPPAGISELTLSSGRVYWRLAEPT
jgi:hypothetical protein